MKRPIVVALLVVAAVVACSTQKTVVREQPLPAANGLQAVSDFASIADETERSRALFAEVSKVIQHPRCSNCHPAGDRPLQGDESKPHQPLVVRGEDNHGAVGMNCSTCHGESNFQNVPGAPEWHLAPIEMAWTGKSQAEICAQIKDPERNGGKSLAEIVDHLRNDALVSYGWNPPKQFEPAPGTQALFAQLAQAWVDTGAACPGE